MIPTGNFNLLNLPLSLCILLDGSPSITLFYHFDSENTITRIHNLNYIKLLRDVGATFIFHLRIILVIKHLSLNKIILIKVMPSKKLLRNVIVCKLSRNKTVEIRGYLHK